MSAPRKGMAPLVRDRLAEDPIEQFRAWFEQAGTKVPLREAMTLATVDAEGQPNARMVLLKGADEQGFRFFSNYESVKGAELEANPAAALVIYWRELDRQVRVRGRVRRLLEAESDTYFETRPRDSQVAASVSPQSRPIEREELERRYERAEAELEGSEVPRPENWGGYVVEPTEIEFWQGREGRMHDRFRYRRTERGGWKIERLAP